MDQQGRVGDLPAEPGQFILQSVAAVPAVELLRHADGVKGLGHLAEGAPHGSARFENGPYEGW